MGKHSKKKKKMPTVLAALCFTTALALLLSSAGATLAKYIRTDKGNGTAVAAPFYFTSDKLSGDGPYHQLAASEGDTVEITFALSNYVDDLRYSEADVSYTCWAVPGTDSAAEAIADTQRSGNLPGGSPATENITLTLPKSAFESDGTVTVVAKSSPYEKTVSARFGFTAPQQQGLQWTVSEQGSAVILEISGGEGENVTVTWPQGLSPDPFNDTLQGAADGSVTVQMETGSRCALTFLKADAARTFTKEDFAVVVS